MIKLNNDKMVCILVVAKLHGMNVQLHMFQSGLLS